MSVPTTHLAVGALFGLVGVFLLREQEGPLASRKQALNVVLWSSIAAAAPDLDMIIGVHRGTFTNIWVGFVIPALAGSIMATMSGARHPFFRAMIPLYPALFGSHLFLDLFGFTNHHARALWPFSSTRYTSAPVDDVHAYGGITGMDAGMPVIGFVLYFVVYAWAHMRLGASVRDAPPEERKWAVPAFVAGGVVLSLVPFALVWWGGLLYR